MDGPGNWLPRPLSDLVGGLRLSGGGHSRVRYRRSQAQYTSIRIRACLHARATLREVRAFTQRLSAEYCTPVSTARPLGRPPSGKVLDTIRPPKRLQQHVNALRTLGVSPGCAAMFVAAARAALISGPPVFAGCSSGEPHHQWSNHQH